MTLQLPPLITSKDLFDKWRPQIYKITHENSGMIYIGCVYSHGKLYLERFKEHMKGSSSGITALFERNLAKRDDLFICELLEIVSNPLDASTREQVLISQIPKHLSINYLVGSNQVFRSKIIDQFQKAQDDGWCIALKLDDKEITDLQKAIEYYVGTKSDLYSLHKSYETRHRVITTLGWKRGRIKFKERKASGNFTNAEQMAYNKLPEQIASDWAVRSDEYIAQRTSPGLSVMNSEIKCEHCNKSISRGNYHRWHGNKCKLKISDV